MSDSNKRSGFGGLLGGLGGLVDLVQELQKVAESAENAGDGTGEKTFTTPGGLSGVIGVNIRTNLAGEPRVETFGNVVRGQKGPAVDPVREPMVDLIEEAHALVILAELPGADPLSIQIKMDGHDLLIEASGAGGRKYAKRIHLERPVRFLAEKHRYQNGILEITLPWKDV
jgi:HSP20 family protein